jgi:Fur family transcriptional regulator, ferric uptake regulator
MKVVRSSPVSNQNRFREYLRDHGLAFTSQRRMILDLVSGDRSHFDAEELVATLRGNNCGVSRATVYRTLTHLQGAGLIREVPLGNEHAHFEYIAGAQEHHEHLVCEECGAVIEFSDPLLEERISSVAGENAFKMTKHTVQIQGLCRRCRGRKKT